MNVARSTLNESTTIVTSWEVNAWEFGPAPTLKIYNSFGGEVETGPFGFESTLNRNADYTFSVRVPRQFFESLGLAAGYIGVEIFGIVGGADVYVRAGYNYTASRWEKESIMVKFDGTVVADSFSFTSTSRSDSGNEYVVNVTGHFTDTALQGYYYCAVKTLDNKGNEVKLGSLSWLPQNMFKSFRLIILKKTSGFTVSFLDENGQPIKYVKNGPKFKITINATSRITYAIFAIDKGDGTWIVLEYKYNYNQTFTVGEGYRVSEYEYAITRTGSPTSP